MGTLRRFVRNLPGDDRGATAAEYALIAALIAMVVIAAVALLGGNVFDLFDGTASSFAEF